MDRGCHSFISKRSGRAWKATEDQMILMHVWRIPREKISINTLNERLEEAMGVYAKDDCSIQAAWENISQCRRIVILQGRF